MYNLLIVEDETFTREGLLRHIDWKSLGIAHVKLAANGQQASELLETYEPHILLSDIKMPHMNGIELGSIIRAKYPYCKIIFLSGYADKEFLLSAIALKAECFIEKPVNIQEVVSAVSGAVSQLDRENPVSVTPAEHALDLLPLLQKQMIRDLMTENLNWHAFSHKYIPKYFRWNKEDAYYLSCISFCCKGNAAKQEDILSDIFHCIENYSQILSSNYYVDMTGTNELTILFHTDNSCLIHGALTALQKHFYEKNSMETTIGISRRFDDLLEFAQLYKNTSNAVSYQYFYYGGQCIFEVKTTLKEKKAPTEIFSKKNFVLDGVERLFQILEQEKYTNVYEIRLQLYEFYTLMMERTMNDNTLSWEKFEHFSLKEYIDLIGYGMQAYQILGNNLYDIKIKNAVHYILWNYQKTDLSIQMVSEHSDLSPNYLCSLFKKQTGSTVNDFIVKVRMDKARILLEKTDMKLYEIAERVGMTDSNYFSTLFKNEYGVTPSKYRRNYAAEKESLK